MKKMIAVKANFVNYEWDNYQGGSGLVIRREKSINLPCDTKLSDIKEQCINWLNMNGFCDDWGKYVFTGRGLINLEIL